MLLAVSGFVKNLVWLQSFMLNVEEMAIPVPAAQTRRRSVGPKTHKHGPGRGFYGMQVYEISSI